MSELCMWGAIDNCGCISVSAVDVAFCTHQTEWDCRHLLAWNIRSCGSDV